MGKTKEFFIKFEKETKENQLTSFGGAPLFLEFLQAIQFGQLVEKLMPAKSDQGYAPVQYILSIILINILGGDSVSDVDALESDSGLKRLLGQWENCFENLKNRLFSKGRVRVFPSPSRIFGFLNQFNHPAEQEERESTPKGKSKILHPSDQFESLKKINQEVIHIASRLNPQETATLDLDNNIIRSKKSNAKCSYKKFPSYAPFNVYWDEMDLMVTSEFRDGNVPAGFEQTRLLKEALELLPSSVKKVYLRSDSAGYQHDLLEYLDSGKSRFGKIEFAISANVTQEIRKLTRGLPEDQWKRVKYIDENGIIVETSQEVAEIAYVPSTKNTSKKAPVFRYIVTREAIDMQYRFTDEGRAIFDSVSEEIEKKLHLEVMNNHAHKIFAIVTNRVESPLEILLWHRKRCGRSEEEHSRLTSDMAGGRFPSDSFGENAAWWMLSILSLNLLKLFQRGVLPKEYKRSRIKRLNQVILRIALKIVKSSGSLKVKVPLGSKLFEFIDFSLQRIVAIKARMADYGSIKARVPD